MEEYLGGRYIVKSMAILNSEINDVKLNENCFEKKMQIYVYRTYINLLNTLVDLFSFFHKTLTVIFIIAGLDGADTALSAVESNLTAMETAVNDLTTALKNVTDELDSTFTACGGACTGSKPDYAGAVPDIDTSAVSNKMSF